MHAVTLSFAENGRTLNMEFTSASWDNSPVTLTTSYGEMAPGMLPVVTPGVKQIIPNVNLKQALSVGITIAMANQMPYAVYHSDDTPPEWVDDINEFLADPATGTLQYLEM